MQRNDYLQKSKTYKGFHYSVLKPEDLDYLHKRTLEMFTQVKDIFEKNNIKYMICGGTLLGAIGGDGDAGRFIPWDDDFDVCIFEEDYEKAISCLTDTKLGLSNGTVLQCTQTDPNYYLGWMKIRDTYSHVYPDAPKFKENGVWIDLYKLVCTKANEVPVLIAEEAISYLNRRLAAGGLTRKEYDERINNGHLLDNLKVARQQKENDTNTEEVYIIWSASKVVLKKAWVEPLRQVVFERMEVTTFKNAEAYLIEHYGSGFKEYPPDEMRRVGINRVDW